jgi:hypothetical protein
VSGGKFREALFAILEEIFWWLGFSVLLPLFYLAAVPLMLYLFHKPVPWADLVKNGVLLSYATTITARAAGNYHKSVPSPRGLVGGLCILGLTTIIGASCVVYGGILVVGLDSSGSGPILGSSERLATFSTIVALLAMMFSLVFTLHARFSGGSQLPGTATLSGNIQLRGNVQSGIVQLSGDVRLSGNIK